MMYVPHRFELKVGLLFLLGLFLLACDGQELSQHAPAGNNRQAENPGDVQAEAVIVIEDVSQLLQVKPSFSNGEESDQFTYLEAMGGGLGVLDFDKDGWPDLFFPGGGKIPDAGRISPLPGKLLRNRIGKQFVDVSGSAMVDRARYSTQGVAVADINSDGFPELLVTGYGGIDLFANQGDGTFVQVADEMELTDPLWSSSAGFGDFDADGLLDLFVAHYVDWSWVQLLERA